MRRRIPRAADARPYRRGVTCSECGGPVTRRHGPKTPICSPRCSRARENRARREARARSCDSCGRSSLERPGNWQRFCSPECSPRRKRSEGLVSGGPCRTCGSPTPWKRRRYCSDACMAAWHRARSVERWGESAERRRAQIERIGERDGWRCHLCRRRVARRNATRDHLVPMADGGSWADENLALAHMRCNSRRGRGRLPAQLRLIA